MNASPEIIELGQSLDREVLHMPAHPPFLYEMTVLHKEEDEEGELAGSSSGVDRIATGLHVGTHIDSLSHVAMNGCLFDGTEVFAAGVQDTDTGLQMRSGSGLRPIVAPGVLLDLPRHLDCEVLDGGHTITVDELQGCAEEEGVEIEPGTVVLIRTGFDLYWDENPARFLEPPMPGPGVEAARFLREAGVVATGSDTAPYEAYPSDAVLAVHVELLVRGGIFIIECMRLRELAERGLYRFQFVTVPLKMGYATGSPINPIAIVER